MSHKTFEPYKLGPITLANHIVMAPMTRSRAPGGIPNEMMVTYYRQRAGAGLIVTEGTSPAPEGLGYARIPGLFNREHVIGWKRVTDAVHHEGGHIFVQLMHTGRIFHELNLPAGAKGIAIMFMACFSVGIVETCWCGTNSEPTIVKKSRRPAAREVYVKSLTPWTISFGQR